MRILVVDDSNVVKHSIIQELRNGGYEAVGANNGEDGLTLLKSEAFDLVTLDIDMPGMDGYEVCEHIRQSDDETIAQIPVIFVTAEDTLQGRQRGFEVGAADFITKRDLKGEVLQVVNSTLQPEQTLVGLNALVVDDQLIARNILTKTLSERGATVHEAVDGQDAFDQLAQNKQGFDIIISDENMPHLTGSELTLKVRQVLGLRDIPIILVTANEDGNKILDFFKNGGTDCLHKPILKEELHARLSVHLKSLQMNQQLQDYVAELKDANAAKDDFLAVCSHDLKSPLNAILGYTQFLLEEDLSENAHDDVLKIEGAGKMLMKLINDILDISCIQSENVDLSMEESKLSMLAIECYRMNERLAERKGVEFNFMNMIMDNEPYLQLNISAMTRVINNLISNAIKFTPKAGKVRMVLELKKDYVQFSVVDSGIGIKAENIDNLFRKYSSASRSGTDGEKGTGLGLSIVKEIVKKHHGTVSVKSVEGEGSLFRFNLPIS